MDLLATTGFSLRPPSELLNRPQVYFLQEVYTDHWSVVNPKANNEGGRKKRDESVMLAFKNRVSPMPMSGCAR